MFYILTILIPFVILFIVYFSKRNKPQNFVGYLNLFLSSLPSMYGYSFLLYYLETEKFIQTSWTTYSIFFFLVPITLIAVSIKLFLWVKNQFKL